MGLARTATYQHETQGGAGTTSKVERLQQSTALPPRTSAALRLTNPITRPIANHRHELLRRTQGQGRSANERRYQAGGRDYLDAARFPPRPREAPDFPPAELVAASSGACQHICDEWLPGGAIPAAIAAAAVELERLRSTADAAGRNPGRPAARRRIRKWHADL